MENKKKNELVLAKERYLLPERATKSQMAVEATTRLQYLVFRIGLHAMILEEWNKGCLTYSQLMSNEGTGRICPIEEEPCYKTLIQAHEAKHHDMVYHAIVYSGQIALLSVSSNINRWWCERNEGKQIMVSLFPLPDGIPSFNKSVSLETHLGVPVFHKS